MLIRPIQRIVFSIGVGLVLLFLAGVLIPGGLELRITPEKGGRPLMVLPMRVNERFTIRYYHSVENAPIWETHSIDGSGRIYIEEERYLKFGAGMGHMPEFGRMVHRDPYEVIENMHMPTGDFILRIGSPGVDHTVIWQGLEKNLSAVAPHVAVRFHAQPVSLFHRLWRGLYPHPATPKSGAKDVRSKSAR